MLVVLLTVVLVSTAGAPTHRGGCCSYGRFFWALLLAFLRVTVAVTPSHVSGASARHRRGASRMAPPR